MKNSVVSSAFVAVFAYSAILNAQHSERKSVAVTVYNSDLGVVKERRSFEISSGISKISLTDVASSIDPTTVHISLNGEVLEQNYQYDLVGIGKILEKYLDKEIQLTSEKGEVFSGTLLAYSNGLTLRKADGGLLMIPNNANYRIAVGALPEGLITKPTLVWTVKSKSAGKQDVDVSYQTGGMKWHAEYVAVLNENDTKMDVQAWVSVENNSGASYPEAKLKLVAGEVNKAVERMEVYGRAIPMMKAATDDAGAFQEKEFFEYHIYDLQRPTTIANNETKQISLFEANGVPVSKHYVHHGGRGVEVTIEFDNKEKFGLGMPIPKGKVRMNKSDGKSVEFIGEDWVNHTPREEKIKIKLGEAFDVVAEEKQTDTRKISDRVAENTFEITLKNRKKEEITVEVVRTMGGDWEILKNSHPFEKQDASTVIFKVSVPSNEEAVLKYKVRNSW